MTDYTVNFTDVNTSPITILRGDVDLTSVDIALFGQLTLEYGEQLNEALLHILENFSCPEDGDNPGNPERGKLTTPVHGQFWHNKTNGLIYFRCKECYDGSDGWVPLRRADDVAALHGVITNGEQIPQPISQVTGRIFEYDECVWSIAPAEYNDIITEMDCYTDSEANVTMTYVRDTDDVVVDGTANYLIIGVRGNNNLGVQSTPIPSPSGTPLPTPGATPDPTPAPTATAGRTPTPTPTQTMTQTPTQTVTPTPSVTEGAPPSATPTQTPTGTPVNTPTGTPAQTVTPTPTPSNSSLPDGLGEVSTSSLLCNTSSTVLVPFTFYPDGSWEKDVYLCGGTVGSWLTNGFHPDYDASDYTWEVINVTEENGVTMSPGVGETGDMSTPLQIRCSYNIFNQYELTELYALVRITGPFNTAIQNITLIVRNTGSGG